MKLSDYQWNVQAWMMHCFGPKIAADVTERNHRFLEEALELVQSTGCTASEAHQLVDYVFGRPTGKPFQETGGVMVTLSALCTAIDINMEAAGNVELARVWTKAPEIRAKQAAKPAHSPLPEEVKAPLSWLTGEELWEIAYDASKDGLPDHLGRKFFEDVVAGIKAVEAAP